MMAVFTVVFLKIISVLLNVVIGFAAGRWMKVERESIATLLFYFIAPIVFFSIPAYTHLDFSSLGIVVVTFCLSSLLSISSYFIFSKYLPDNRLNLVATSAGSANSGYFMLPIATSLFDNHTLGIYMMAAVGINIYEASLGYYMCARSVISMRESIIKVIKSPTLNAFAFGCILSFSGITLPNFLNDFILSIRSSFTILGMIMIGLGISTLQRFELDARLTIASFCAKFIFYPVVINLFILLDRNILHWYNETYYDVLQLISTAPLAANTVVFASIMRLHPERMAAAVLLSALFALIYIPFVVSLIITPNV